MVEPAPRRGRGHLRDSRQRARRRPGRRSRSTTAPTCSRVTRAGQADGLIGGTEETTTGLLRLRLAESEGGLRCPVLAVNESRTERTFNDRYGTGQSALDGILRATNLLLAGHTLVLLGYGFAGRASPSAPAAPGPR